MSQLFNILKENNVHTENIQEIKRIEDFIWYYVNIDKKSVNTNGINEILYISNHYYKCDFMFIYEILFRYGYKLKNNYVAFNIFYNLLMRLTEDINYDFEDKIDSLIKHSEIKKYLKQSEIIIIDRDIDNISKLKYEDEHEIISELIRLNKEIKKLEPKFPKVIFKFKKYNNYNISFLIYE